MNLLNRYKKGFIIILVSICFVLIFLSIGFRYKPTVMEEALSYITIPIQKSVTGIINWSNQKISFYINLKDLEQENIKLKEENEYLLFQIKRLELVEKDNENLSRLFEMDQKYRDYPKIGAQIIAKDIGNWNFNFIIDKGRANGLDNNMVVISYGGLVGRIIETGLNYSKIVSIIDDTSAVSAMNARTEDVGIVKGDLSLTSERLVKMEYINIDAEIMEGDEIITSNLGNIYPPGITIGYVREINTDTNGLTKSAVIKPAVDFDNMSSVLVINEKFDRILEH